jgi:putative nucleotidyltransferase with HDIG domain
MIVTLLEVVIAILVIFSASLLYFHYKLVKDKAKDEYIINTTRNVSRKMYELGSEEDFIRSICETVQNITHSDEFSYFKYVPEEALLVPQYVVGPYKDQISRVKIKIGEGFTGHVAKEKKAMFLNDAEKSSIGKHIPGTPNENTSLLAIPIIFSSNLLGVALQTKLGGFHFNKEELNLSEIFVNLAAVFIAGENYVHSIRQGFVDMLKVLITTVELKDTYTAGHSIRVSKISEIIGKEMGLSQKEIAIAKIGGLLHDIGKIGVQEAILRKNSNLKAKEIDEIKTHPTLGSELISKFKIFTGVPEAILYHHEWYNGNGYPKGLKGEQIPILSRIIAVSDAIDAMATGRPGRTTKTAEEAFIELEKWSNTQFDSRVVKAALKKKDEIEEALEEGLNIERFATEEDFERISS